MKRRRGLFWSVYGALVLSLILMTVVGAGLWRHLVEDPMRGFMRGQGRAIAALMPPPEAPLPVTVEAVRRVSRSAPRRVTLADAGCRPIASANRGVLSPPPPDFAETCRRLLTHGDRGAMERHRPHGPPPDGPPPDGHRHEGRPHDGHRGPGGPPGPGFHLPIDRAIGVELPDGRMLVLSTPPAFSARHLHGLLILLFVALIIGLAAYPAVSAITRRLERVRASVEAWGDGDLSRRAPVEGRDEIAAVAAAFNTAADKAERLLAAHKALLAHASHELRSPLARLRMASELFADKPAPELKAAIGREIAELDGLVEEILLASRLDHGADAGEREPVDLLALAAEEAARAGVELSPAGAGPFDLTGSPRLLRRLIRNLIENALKHGGPPVSVTVSRTESLLSVAVADHGPGVPEAERERVFEPFYRPGGASEAAGSWGLGLALVRQIAGRHGGTVRCEGGGGVTRFVAELPAESAR